MADIKFQIEFDSNGQSVIKDIADRIDKLGESSKRSTEKTEQFQRAQDLVAAKTQALSAELSRHIQLLNSTDPALTRVLQKYDRMKESANDNAEVLAKIREARSLEISKLEEVEKALKGASDKHETLANASQHVGTVINATAQQLAVFGQHTSVFAGALGNLLTGVVTPAAIGFTALGLAFAYATKQIEKRRQELERQSEREIADLEKARDLLRDEIEIRSKIKELKSSDSEITAIAQAYERVAISIEKRGKPDDVAALLSRNEEAKQLEINKILNERQIAAGKAQQSIVDEIALSGLRVAALSQSAEAVARLSVEQKLQSLETRKLAGEHGALLDLLARVTVQEYKLSEAIRQRDSGQAALSSFEQIFGVSLDSSRNETAVKLADSFVTVFNQFGRDGRNAAAFRQAFQSLIQQALATGAPDIEELLLSRGLSSANLERLKANLGSDLRASLEESRQAGQQWGASLEQDTIRVTRGLRDVGNALDQIDRQLRALQNAALNIGVNFVASPPRPFGEFLPYMQQQFTTLNQIVETRSPNIDIPVRGLPQQLAGLYGTSGFGAAYSQYQTLTRAIETEQQNYYSGFFTQNVGIGNYNQAIASRRLAQFQSQLDTLLLTAGSDAYGAARSSGGGGSGGGSTVMVNIDLRGSTVTPAALDESIIPALERGIIRATGQVPDFRVLN